MATQRYVSTSFWDDKWIRSINPSDRYLYLYLMTNPLTNIAGVYEITLDRIAFDTGYDERTLKPMLEKFARDGKAYFYHEEWMILPTWPKHQQWEKRSKIREGIVLLLKSLPPDLLGYMVKIGYKYPIDTLGIPYTYPSNYSDLDSDLDSDSDSDLDSTRSVCSELPRKGESIEAGKPQKDDKPKAEPLPDSPVYCTIITNSKEEYPITEEMVGLWESTYPAVNVRQQLLSMKAWSISNPKKRKTKAGMLAFVNNWLSKEQDKGHGQVFQGARQSDAPRVADSVLRPNSSRTPAPANGPIVTTFQL